MGFYFNSDDGSQQERRPSADPSCGGLVHELYRLFLDLGRRSEGMGDLGSALALYGKAVKAQPESDLAWYNYGDVLLAMERSAEAIPALQKAVALSPEVPLFHYDLGLALYQMQRYEEAAKEFAVIVSEDPELKRASSGLMLAALTNLALSEDMLGRPDRAVATLTPTAHKAGEMLYNLGHVHLKAKRPAEAVRFLQAAALVAPNDEDTVHALGFALMGLRRYREALRCLKRATTLNPGCESAWYDMGVTLSHLKRTRAARACFRKALSLDSRYAWAHYATACLDALEGKLTPAFMNLRKAIASGFRDLAYLKRDKDLRPLRKDPRWQTLLKSIEGLPEAGRQG